MSGAPVKTGSLARRVAHALNLRVSWVRPADPTFEHWFARAAHPEDRVCFDFEASPETASTLSSCLDVPFSSVAGRRPCDQRLIVSRRQIVEWRSGDSRALDEESAGLSLALERTLQSFERHSSPWRVTGRTLSVDGRPGIVGVVNVTPDSFSDGGQFLDPERAVARARSLVEAGADMIDIGGESTRPSAEPVPAAQQIERVLPVIERLARQCSVPLSIDTTSSQVARAALKAGASIINDTSALCDDPEMKDVVRTHGAGLVLMHRLGPPRTMQEAPSYQNCPAEVCRFLRDAAGRAEAAGIDPEAIVVDPGIGFGKRPQDNLALIREIGCLRSLGYPVLVGTSRKSFLGTITRRPVGERGAATLATTALFFFLGVHWIRVHDVGESKDLIEVLRAVADA